MQSVICVLVDVDLESCLDQILMNLIKNKHERQHMYWLGIIGFSNFSGVLIIWCPHCVLCSTGMPLARQMQHVLKLDMPVTSNSCLQVTMLTVNLNE